jgi:hypothetical protein
MPTPLDYLKLGLGLIGYCGIAPLLGWLVCDSRRLQRWLFGLLVFMTSWHINKLTLMVHSIEEYRGATKGFEISLLDVVAGALLFAVTLRPDRTRRWLPPGTLLYLFYVAMSYVSIFAAPRPLYVNMAAWRFLEQVVVFVAAFDYLRDEEDLRMLLRAVAFTLCFQAVVVLKMKYINHIYQVYGWFEHQNALAMWAYMCGLPLLTMALGPCSRRDLPWCLAGYAASAIIVEAALARASLLAFLLGTALVVAFSWWDGITRRRVLIPAMLALVAAAGLLCVLPTLIHRFGEPRNKESGELREMLAKSSALMLADSAIGIGWNNFALVINKPYHYGAPIDEWTESRGMRVNESEAKPQPESHYWLLLAENGYPGLLSYLLFIGVTTWWCLRAERQWKGTLAGAFLAGLLIALIITYAHSTVERCLTQTKNIAMWLIFLGVAVKLDALAGRTRLSLLKVRLPVRVQTPAILPAWRRA